MKHTRYENARTREPQGSLVSLKNASGFRVPYPEPQMDWDEIRRLKQKCSSCGSFDELKGGCRMLLLASKCVTNLLME